MFQVMYSAQAKQLKKVQAELQAEKDAYEVASNLAVGIIHDAEDARKITEQTIARLEAELKKVQAELQAEKDAHKKTVELPLDTMQAEVISFHKKTNKREPMCWFCPMRS